jgi:hypothetical protein
MRIGVAISVPYQRTNGPAGHEPRPEVLYTDHYSRSYGEGTSSRETAVQRRVRQLVKIG